MSPEDVQVAEFIWRHLESADSQGNVYISGHQPRYTNGVRESQGSSHLYLATALPRRWQHHPHHQMEEIAAKSSTDYRR